MKKLLVIALGFGLNPLAFAQPAVLIATYNFDAPSPGGTRVATYVNNLVLSSAGDFYNAPTVLPIPSPPGYYANGPTGGNNRALIGRNWTSTFNATKYFGDTLRVVAGQTLVIDSVVGYALSSTLGPANAEMRTNVTGYGAAVGGVFTNNQNSPWKKFKFIPGAVLSSNTFIDFRFYAYGTTNANTTWRIDSVKVYGHLDGIFNLPIELTKFYGRIVPEGIALDWTTASESENDYFTVMRSENAIDWTPIADIDGAGESQSEIRYGFVDVHPLVGTNYYKLRQTDHDGDFEDSHTIAIFWQLFDSSWTRVYGLGGNLIRDWATEHLLLPAGIYILRDKSGRTKKFIASP